MARLRALIVDGQNGHDIWPKTTAMMKSYLEETSLFEVEVARTAFVWQGDPCTDDGGATTERRRRLLADYPAGDGRQVLTASPQPDPGFAPDFRPYQLVIANIGWRAAPWPRATEVAFERYVAAGGGFLPVHAANNAFPEWPAWNLMCGIGGWGGRDERSGPRLYIDEEGREIRDPGPGTAGSHGREQEFIVTMRNRDHAVTRGLPERWMHARDELYERLRGPAKSVEILATAHSDVEANACYWAPVKGSGMHEPMVLTKRQGLGRVFHLVLGHFDYTMECVGFITLLQRGAEWAATGEVTQELPGDFPTAESPSLRPWRPRTRPE